MYYYNSRCKYTRIKGKIVTFATCNLIFNNMEYGVKYIIGYPGWDNKRNVNVSANKGVVRIYEPVFKKEILINGQDILDISFDAKSKRSGARAATGALIGGVLTGGIGLLAGAAIGAKAKDKSEIVLLFNENGRERQVLLQTKDKTNAVFNLIQDAIADAKANPGAAEEEKEIRAKRTEMEKSKSDPSSTIGGIIVITVFVVLIFFFLIKCAG